MQCDILETKTEEDCRQSWLESSRILEENSVQKRLSADCSNYFHGHNSSSLYYEKWRNETNLAFSLVVHNQIGLFEALLSSIFRPYHSYCIFVDAKATSRFKTLVKALIGCYKANFPKVSIFEPEQTHSIYWSDYSLLQADFVCMTELLKRNKKWSHFLNQAGTVMPQLNIQQMASFVLNVGEVDSIFSMNVISRYLIILIRWAQIISGRGCGIQVRK